MLFKNNVFVACIVCVVAAFAMFTLIIGVGVNDYIMNFNCGTSEYVGFEFMIGSVYSCCGKS